MKKTKWKHETKMTRQEAAVAPCVRSGDRTHPSSSLIPHPLLLLGLIALLLAGGCGREPRPPGTIREAYTSDVSTLDPARAYDTSSIPWVRVIYRGLVDYDAKANIVNELAREREVSRDGKTYRFKLRNDAYFENGRRVVGQDFKYALQRVLDPATASDGLVLPGYTAIIGAKEYSDALAAIDKQLDKASSEEERSGLRERRVRLHVPGIEVPSADEIVFHLKDADATFLNYLTLPFAYAIPRETVEQWGDAFSSHPNGCGPFVLKEWIHDTRMVLEKNPRYFRKDLPRVDRIELQMQNSTTLQIMRFEEGDLDIIGISDAFPPDFLRLRNDPRRRNEILHAPMMDIRYLCLNTELPPFDNVLVRRAFNYAINRKVIASFLTGRATVAHGALPPGMPGYNPNLFQYSYDPGKARQLLNQAGYKDDTGKPLVLWYSTGEAWYPKAAQAIKSDLRQVGVSIELKQISYSELKAQAGKRKNIHMSLMGWLQDFPDPSNFLDVLFNTKAITNEASQNRAFYSNPKVDKLLDAARIELDREKRLKLYQDAEKIIVDDAPWVFLHHTERFAVHQPWVTGHALHPMWSERAEYVGVKP